MPEEPYTSQNIHALPETRIKNKKDTENIVEQDFIYNGVKIPQNAPDGGLEAWLMVLGVCELTEVPHLR